MPLEIVHFPHPALRWKSKPITRIDTRLRSTVAEMFELMYEAKGVGLAANQVALPWRVFVANPTGEPEEKDFEWVFVNPEIVDRKGNDEAEEGCLSLPDLYGPVRRPERIVVEAFDLQGQEFRLELSELPARVIQHENDHLDGIMFIDRMSETSRRELDPRLTDFETVFRRRQESGQTPADEQLEKTLRELEPKD